MIFLNSNLASALTIACETIQLPTFTGTDATKGSLRLVFADFKIEVWLPQQQSRDLRNQTRSA